MCSLKEDRGLDFKRFDKFNIALLAKQGWRLVNYPNSLLARVLKAKYYVNSNFLNAPLGNSPSLTWKSIWSAKGLLEKGLCWRVGKGDSISDWTDLWVSDSNEDRIQNVHNNKNIVLVSDLIDEVNRSWKAELIANTFPVNIARRIMQIPLVRSAHDDLQVWKGEPSGNFSVRSAYILMQKSTLNPSNFLQANTKAFYKKLWNINMPLKIKITAWKISWDFIPTFSNLKLKRVPIDDRSPRCHQNGEDSNHVFQQCPTTVEV
ncbi:hypothetical protein PVK06_002898 [Gossypium arboreum]|uniref:Reverse transcriptase zinc-binding domain-containing protein n=1 Tax=Gossypium arboreum TaxID=29729 RepID=A0ABR0R606_GOSAR|nr:hypothetical protein PVK06_002898 [Gossypium arboreum]